jgi:hypothetical protein
VLFRWLGDANVTGHESLESFWHIHSKSLSSNPHRG